MTGVCGLVATCQKGGDDSGEHVAAARRRHAGIASAVEHHAAVWHAEGGVVTFQNAKKLASVVPAIPDHRLLIETDAPYLTPVPFRGRINHSGYLRYTAKQIAQLRHTDPDTVADLTRRNAEALFGISVKTS